MNDLIAKLEAATEGSRELDAEICEAIVLPATKAIGDAEVTEWFRCEDDRYFGCRTNDGWLHSYYIRIPAYTTSLDAALTLVPEQWTWFTGQFRRQCEYPGSAQLLCATADPSQIKTYAATAPLALCIAALKARS